MTDLIYPASTAPLLRGSDRSAASEMLPVVDEHGNVIAQASRAFCHGCAANPKSAIQPQPAAARQTATASDSVRTGSKSCAPGGNSRTAAAPTAKPATPASCAHEVAPEAAPEVAHEAAAKPATPDLEATKPIHPVVHLHIVSRDGRIYLQQRSATKDLLPLRWDTAVGGHVAYGEYILEALYREASEELGFTDFNPVFITSYVFESEAERELVNVFATVGDFVLKPDGDEVIAGRYWSPEEIEAACGKGILTPNFESEYHKIKNSLQALL